MLNPTLSTSDSTADPSFTDSDDALSPVRHVYSITALAEPSVLARVVEMFVLRDLIPASLTCRQQPGADGVEMLRIEVEVAGMHHQHAEHVAHRMRNIMPVAGVMLARA
jgi:acetolactate synthase small subunit